MTNAPIEFELLLACLRRPLNDADRARIASLLCNQLDAARFSGLVRHHGVTPIVFRNLNQTAAKSAPHALIAELLDSAREAGTKAMRRVMEIVRLVTALQRHRIKVRILKGIAISLLAYGDATLQDSIDIDLLVSAAQLLDAEKILAECGYIRIVPFARMTPRRLRWELRHGHEFKFIHRESHQSVELHWELAPNRYKYPRFPVEKVSTEHLSLGGRRIPSLGAHEMFLHACIHGAEHYWSRLKWLAPVAAIIRAMTREDFRAVAQRAEEVCVTAELYAAVALAQHYRLIDEGEFAIAGQPGPIARKLIERSRRAIEGAEGNLTNSLGDFRDAWTAASSFAYRRNLIERTIIRHESWDLIDLPDALFFGYVLLSPFAWLAHRRRARRTAFGAQLMKPRRRGPESKAPAKGAIDTA